MCIKYKHVIQYVYSICIKSRSILYNRVFDVYEIEKNIIQLIFLSKKFVLTEKHLIQPKFHKIYQTNKN